jgi:hypothetical protein
MNITFLVIMILLELKPCGIMHIRIKVILAF